MMVLNLLFLQKHIKKNDFTKNVFLIANCYLVHHLVKKDNNFDDEVIRMIIFILDQKVQNFSVQGQSKKHFLYLFFLKNDWHLASELDMFRYWFISINHSNKTISKQR